MIIMVHSDHYGHYGTFSPTWSLLYILIIMVIMISYDFISALSISLFSGKRAYIIFAYFFFAQTYVLATG